jgi:hypothetical protein
MDQPALTKIQSQPQAHCSLMKLPPEMRNMIYQWSLVHQTWNWAVDISTEQQPPLLRTCTQIRNEALKIYYYWNIFSFTTLSTDAQALQPITAWLGRIG